MRVSAIIPAFNAALYVEQAVESALAQDGVETEVIVVDDSSTDGTWQKLESFGDRIRKVRQTNGGPAKARNHGARLATGEWLAFLDADDEWLPEKTAKQLRCTDSRTGMVYTDRFNIGDISRVKPVQSDSVSLWDGDVFERLLLDNFITTSSVIIRKERFEQLGGFDESRALLGVEDWDLWLRHAADGRVGLCREPLVRYRWQPGSLSSNFDHLSRARLEVIQRALALPRGQRIGRKQARRAVAQAWECSASFAAPNHRWKALRWYLRSALWAPLNLRLYKGMVKCCLGRT
jgi:glycosyltransferase involved in cell wall biosynthesis